jgi:hypothetical protein
MNALKPFEYLKHIFQTMPNIAPEMYAPLLPWSETLPDICKLAALPGRGRFCPAVCGASQNRARQKQGLNTPAQESHRSG